ncbi:MAG: single-stranded DNA-binding protein [Candidatus Acidiferrales bacterium]
MYQNRVHLLGYLGKHPEHKSVKTTDRKYAVLSLATQRSWKDADEEWHSKTESHRVVAWNRLGEYAASKLRKGDRIYLQTRDFLHGVNLRLFNFDILVERIA